MGRWIDFVDAGSSDSGKTKKFDVLTKEGGVLGKIKWFTPWRRYCFFPHRGTVYEHDCCRDIAAFLDSLKKENRRRP